MINIRAIYQRLDIQLIIEFIMQECFLSVQYEMSKQLITYMSPRLAILKIDKKQNHQKYMEAQLLIKSRHKTYFHIFNLTSYDFADSNFGSVDHTNFKWREIPYSLSQTIKILASIQNYQVKNAANAAIIAVFDQLSYGFALFIVQVYWKMLGIKKLGLCHNQHVLAEFCKIYKSIDIKNPPIKIIDSLSFKNADQCFIPIVKIFNESRHNNFEQIHTHNPQQELTNYYLQRKKPLNEGIGLKFCEKRPETKHFNKPIVVFGDVKIEVYSYTSLKYERQFVCGFNTKAMEFGQSLVQFDISDLYEVANVQKLGKNQQIILEISDYCQKCNDEAKCTECLQAIKKLGSTYSVAQIELQKICRNRLKQEALKIMG